MVIIQLVFWLDQERSEYELELTLWWKTPGGHRGPEVRDLENYQREEDTSTFLKQWSFALYDICWLWNETSNPLHACHTL